MLRRVGMVFVGFAIGFILWYWLPIHGLADWIDDQSITWRVFIVSLCLLVLVTFLFGEEEN